MSELPELPRVDTLVATRRALHRVAEHVLSAARKTETGHIGLRPGPGGFRTPPFDDGRVIAVNGTDLEVVTATDVRRAPLTTLRAAAALAGIEPGFPWTTHPPATPLEPDEPLSVDPSAAATLAGWYALGDEALRRLAADLADEQPSAAQIYPEHFDLGLAAAGVNYGVSPGDDGIALPYLYVGPHDGPPTRDAFWNAAFGAYVTIGDIRSADAAFAFFREGHDRLRTQRVAVSP